MYTFHVGRQVVASFEHLGAHVARKFNAPHAMPLVSAQGRLLGVFFVAFSAREILPYT